MPCLLMYAILLEKSSKKDGEIKRANDFWRCKKSSHSYVNNKGEKDETTSGSHKVGILDPIWKLVLGSHNESRLKPDKDKILDCHQP